MTKSSAPTSDLGLDALELVKGFTVTVNGLEVAGKPPFTKWDEMLAALRVASTGGPFAIGDLLNKAEDAWGEASSQLVDSSEWSEKTVADWRRVAKAVEMAIRRMDRLTWAHHQAVAPLTPAKQKKWLNAAADGEAPWTVGRLKQALKDGGDSEERAWWALVECKDAGDQETFIKDQEAAGRTCKAVSRRGQKKGD